MIDYRTNRDVWVHGCQHVEAGRLEDADRCLTELCKRAEIGCDDRLMFYQSHLRSGLLVCVLKKVIDSLENKLSNL